MARKRIFSCISLCVLMILIASVESSAAMLRKGKLSNLSNEPVERTQENKPNRRILPTRGDIAVVVEGDDRHYAATAEAMIIEELASRGYRIVDEAKMKRIKAAAARAKAAIYALEGNVAGILSLNAHYSVGATVVARVRAGVPRMNEARLYTGSATITLLAVTSGGVKLGGQTARVEGRDGIIGYTVDDTMDKAIYEVVRRGMEQLF
ncbi:MAG: hypothetical protein IJ587_07890 [Synergistaceae bacterium]|nr:hypothetical protein [Synergistaceae bacterium]